ncbi:MAG: hypothetical protein H0T79_10665 [Deltaproteobacteria bacterium]|nr:hypothetical protein [Deltaproteobacteria bacterium]
MAVDTPSSAPPIPESRHERTRNTTTGYDDLNTASNHDAPGKKTRVGIAESIGKVSAAVSTEGAVTAKAITGGKVRVDSGWAKMIADVELKPDVDPDPPHFRIGWVQTLVSSRRVGVYKTPKGDTISQIQDTGTHSDRREYWGDPSKPRMQVAAPWYDLPEELGTDHRKIHINAFDKPGFALSPSVTEEGPFKGAKLVAVQGSESFLTSLKAGDGGEHTLKTWQWAVPWDVNVDGIAADTRSGGALPAAGVSSADNPNLTGPTAVTANHSQVLEAYGTVDAAALKLQEIGYSSFVTMLAKHKTAAADSYWNMIGALWKSNAQLRVQVIKGKEPLSKDVKVGFKADGDYAANQSGSVFTMLAHMVLDPNAGMATPIAITVNGRVVMTVPAPYDSNKTDTKVTLPGSLYGTNEDDVTVKFSIS